MRKVLIALAAAASALAVAAPAAAQWMPQPASPGYAYGNPGQAGTLLARIGQLRAEIRQLDMRNMLRFGEARRLDREAMKLDQRVRRAAFYGLSPAEGYDVERRLARLQQRIQLAANWSNRRYGYSNGGYGGYGGYGSGGYRYGYGGIRAVIGRTNYYSRSPSRSVQIMRRAPVSISNNDFVSVRNSVSMPSMSIQRDRAFSSGGRDMQRMSSMRAERSSGFSSGGRDMQRMSSMRAERSSGFSSGGRGMGGARRGGGRDRRD